MYKLKKLKTTYTGMSQEVKAAFWFVVCNFLQKGITAITTPIFTRLLLPSDYGIYNLYNSWYSVLRIIITLNMTSGVFNNAMIKYKNNKNEYVSSLQGLAIVTAGLGFFIYFIGEQFWSKFIELPFVVVALMFLEFAITPAREFWLTRNRFEFNYKSVVIVTLITSILVPTVSVVAISLSNEKGYARIFSIIFVTVTVSLFLFIRNFLKGKKFFNREMWLYSLKFNIPLMPHFLSSVLLSSSDVIMINHFFSNSEAGIYGVGRAVAYMFDIVKSSILQTLTPWLYTSIEKKEYKGLKKIITLVIAFFGGCMAILSIVSPELIAIFADKPYSDAKFVVAPLAMGIYFLFVSGVFVNVQLYYEKNKYVSLVSIISTVLNLLLNLVLIEKCSYVVLAYTSMFGYLLCAVLHGIKARRVLKTNIEEPIIDFKAISLFTILIVVVSLGVIYLYNYIVIRYCLVLCVLCYFYLKRNEIKSFMKG